MPNKKLGQNFLMNEKIIKKVVNSVSAISENTIIEIGPGKGAITQEILKLFTDKKQDTKIKYIGIEKDGKLIEHLSNEFGLIKAGVGDLDAQVQKHKQLIIEGDILKVLPQLSISHLLRADSYKLVGNIPFYLTGYLLRTIGNLENKPKKSILLVQKEVAERLVAEPPKMNLLAASVQYWATTKLLRSVPKENFDPQPKVDGSIVKLVTKKGGVSKELKERYYKTIKTVFKHPRKNILNNLRTSKELKSPDINKKLKTVNIGPKDRPENLSVEKLQELSSVLW